VSLNNKHNMSPSNPGTNHQRYRTSLPNSYDNP